MKNVFGFIIGVAALWALGIFILVGNKDCHAENRDRFCLYWPLGGDYNIIIVDFRKVKE